MKNALVGAGTVSNGDRAVNPLLSQNVGTRRRVRIAPSPLVLAFEAVYGVKASRRIDELVRAAATDAGLLKAPRVADVRWEVTAAGKALLEWRAA